MTKNAIRWRVVPRDAVTEYLLQGVPEHESGRSILHPGELSESGVGLGYFASFTRRYRPVSLLVLKSESAVEALSWLRTYSPAVSPVSQFARVLTEEDWNSFGQPRESEVREGAREDIWASVVLGETIAQSDTDLELPQVPLSRAGSCFTYPVARAACIHGAGKATSICAERLLLVESDRRFAQRHVPISDLFPIWSLATADVVGEMPPEDAVDSLLRAVTKLIPGNDLSLRTVAEQVRGRKGLGSDSIEERVLAFQRVSGELLQSGLANSPNGVGAAILAASAFLVGRGTSHEFLLRRLGRAYPSSPVWFGLIAALCGPSAWDEHWTRAAKGIERQLRAPFDLCDSSGHDLCWPEFRWYEVAFSNDVFSTLTKLTPRALTIEIVPGATCQFRLSGGAASEGEPHPMVEIAQRVRDLESILAQFLSLSNKARKVLEDVPGQPVQHSFLDDQPKSYKSKKRRYGDA